MNRFRIPHYKLVRLRQWVAVGIILGSIALELLWAGSTMYNMIQ